MIATQRGFLASPITSSVVDMPNFPMSRRNILLIGAALPFTSSVDQTGKVPKYFREEIQAKIDKASVKGGIVTIPPGIFEIDAPIEMRSGVSLVGSGRHYAYEADGNKFTGSWIKYRGSSNQPAVRFRSVQHCSIKNLGVDCGESFGTTAIEIGSNNNPASKSLIFEEISIFGASVAVQWGIGNRLSKTEQCDDITFREIGVYSCDNGFIINAANSSDYSSISRVSMSNIKNIAFDLIGPGFLNIENCAIGSLGKKSIGFRITGSSPDPVNISNCQIEPYGTFLVAEGPNDEGQIILSKNVINNPVIVSGILRITSLNNYINSTISIKGFVRWRSRDDVWAGVHERPMHEPQVFASEDAHFLASSLINASRYIGSYLPKNFVLENIDGPASGKVVITPGIVCKEFVKGTEYSVGDYVRPRINNGVAYKVVSAGSFPIEPNWGDTRIKLGKLELEPVGAAAVFQSFGLLPR